MTNSSLPFSKAFKDLTGHDPFPWQRSLYDRFLQGTDNIPSACNLPTGLGKTNVIAVWLIALAQSASDNAGVPRLPRRLVYIVNRRTVVDQATDIVAQMRERLRSPADPRWAEHGDTLRSLADALRLLAGAGDGELPLAVSTLRGELADNQEWKVNPARPAIIIGTIDMIGSKLLFSGYGDGRYGRAQHAGLIGQDTLIVHDEAHLTPAFSALLRAVEEEQQREMARAGSAVSDLRPIRVMELSATTRNAADQGEAGTGPGGDCFGIEDEDASDVVVQQRVTAAKRLSIADVQGNKKDGVVGAIVEEALRHEGSGCRVLVYVRKPECAADVAGKIVKAIVQQAKDAGQRVSEAQVQERVRVLTGTIRGYERDQLAESELFKAFKADPDRPATLDQTLYLVSTSAGEVGVDWDADHLVCDLTTLDSMIQRFGRVNRLGGDRNGKPREATITVVVGPVEEKDALKTYLEKTVEALRRLPVADGTYDASPRALADLLKMPEAQAAFAPSPRILPASDILFDAWSLTSVDADMPGRPAVAEYLHGVTAEPPETYVAWRAEVSRLAEAKVDQETLAKWSEACPILSHERLRERTDEVREALKELLKQKRKTQNNFDVQVVLLSDRGEARFETLSELADKPKNRDPLAYATVVLPVEIGGLNKAGMLDSNPKETEKSDQLDVAEELPRRTLTGARQSRRERWLFIRDADGERWKNLLTGEEVAGPPVHLRERVRVTLKPPPEGQEDESEIEELVVFVEQQQTAADSPEQAKFREGLSRHLERVAEQAHRIGAALGLPNDLREALERAACWHDRGKDRPRWQRYACNADGGEPLAKSEKYRHWRELAGYRHEFGSLLEAMADPEIREHPQRELILHLIAAHHGHGRPHFDEDAYDNEGPRDPTSRQRRRPTTRQNEEVAVQTVQRFGRLQQRFGRWGLAWLESLLRCADALASRAADRSSDTSTSGPFNNRCADTLVSRATQDAVGENAV